MATSAPANQSRESPIVMPRSTRAVNRPHASSASILTGKAWPAGRAFGNANVKLRQRQPINRRRLARHAVVVHRVHAVGGDVHLVERAVALAEIEDALYGNAAQG